MDLVKNNVSASIQRIRVVHKPHKKYSSGHESNLSSLRRHCLHAYLVSDPLANRLIQLLSYPFGDVDGC